MPINMSVPVELTDLFPDETCSLEHLAECLGALPLNLVLVMCARANQVLSGPGAMGHLDRQKTLANTMLTTAVGKRLNDTARARDKDHPDRTSFLVRNGLLELVRWALLLCDPKTPPLEGEWTQKEKDPFVQAAIMCAWISDTKTREILRETEDFDAQKNIALVAFRKALDAGMSGPDPRKVVGRGKKLFLEYLPKHYTELEKDFQAALGVSLNEYMTAAGALIAMHLQLPKSMVLSDAVTLGHDTEYAAVYSAYQSHQICSVDDLRGELWPSNQPPDSFNEAPVFSLRPLRDRPIIALDDDKGVIPDPLLLAESLMVGPLFQLLGERDANELFGYFGDAFEEYAGDILAGLFPSGDGLHAPLHRKVFLPDADEQEFELDACLDYIDQLVLIETKAVFIPDWITDECDEAAFRAILREKYLRNKDRPVGIGQLARAIRSLAAGTWQGLDPDSSPKLTYPVLLVHDRLLQEPLVTSFLADLLIEELGASQVQCSWQWETNGFHFAPLTILTIDDLENLESSPGIDLLELLQSYSADVPKRYESLHDYIATTERFKKELRINQTLAIAARNFLADCVRRVFGREPGKR